MDKSLLNELVADLRIDDMPNGDMRMVAENCGIETAVLLMREMPALNIYIPSGWHKTIVERYIQKHHRKVDVKHLALACGVSETFVYNVIRRAKEEARQTTLFASGAAK